MTQPPTGPSGPVRTYRPVGALVVACVAGSGLVVVIAAVAFALPAAARGSFTVAQDVTLALLLGAALAVLFGIGRTRVRTDAGGLHVVNGFRRYDLTWPEVVAVSLGRGAPWAAVDTTDGVSVQLMAIQRADGERAQRAVRELRAAIVAHTPPDPPDPPDHPAGPGPGSVS